MCKGSAGVSTGANSGKVEAPKKPVDIKGENCWLEWEATTSSPMWFPSGLCCVGQLTDGPRWRKVAQQEGGHPQRRPRRRLKQSRSLNAL